MNNNSNEKHIKLWTPATYRIEVEGHLAESWSDRLAGMRITARKRLDIVTKPKPIIMDAALYRISPPLSCIRHHLDESDRSLIYGFP